MDMKKLDEANKLQSLIRVAESNIKGWKNMFDTKEIAVSSQSSTQKMYLTGAVKDKVLETILKGHIDKLTEYQKRFEDL